MLVPNPRDRCNHSTHFTGEETEDTQPVTSRSLAGPQVALCRGLSKRMTLDEGRPLLVLLPTLSRTGPQATPVHLSGVSLYLT